MRVVLLQTLITESSQPTHNLLILAHKGILMTWHFKSITMSKLLWPWTGAWVITKRLAIKLSYFVRLLHDIGP